MASHCQWPHEVFFHLLEGDDGADGAEISRYHCPRTTCDAPTLILVMKGSLPLKSSKTSSNTGIRKATSASSTTRAKMPIIIG